MKRAIVSLCAFALVLSLSGFALAQDEAAPKGEKAFKAMDANSDGKISLEEFKAFHAKRAEQGKKNGEHKKPQ